jgi:hypothetical protein
MYLPVEETLAQEAGSPLPLSEAALRTPEELANIVSLFASSDGWMDGSGAATRR